MPTWTHTDPLLGASQAQGEARAQSGDWASGTVNARVRALRAYMASQVAAQSAMVGTATESSDGRIELDPRPPNGADQARARVAAALAGTWTALAAGNAAGTVETVATVDDAGALPVAAVVVVALGVTAATCYVAYQAADVVDRQLARLTKAKELLQADHTLKTLVDQHTAEERKQGKLLPLSSATTAAIDLIRERQAELAKELPTKTDPGQSFFGTLDTTAKWALALGAAYLVWTELRPRLKSAA